MLTGKGRSVQVSGELSAKRNGWNASVSGNWDLSTFIPENEFLEAGLRDRQFRSQNLRPPGEPQLSGPIRIRDGSVSLPLGPTIVGAEEFQLDANFSSGDLQIQSIDAKLGDGQLTGSGCSAEEIFDQDRRTADVVLELRNVTVEPVNQLSVGFGGSIKIEGDRLNGIRISGKMDLDNALYEDNINLYELVRRITRYLTGRGGRLRTTAARTASDGPSAILDLELTAPGGLLDDTECCAGGAQNHAPGQGDYNAAGDNRRYLGS